MNGSIRCARCNGLVPQSGVCPKCSKRKGEPVAPPVTVWVYSVQSHKNERITTDKNGRRLDYREAYKLLRKIRAEIDDAKPRKTGRGKDYDISPHLPAKDNPNTCDKLLDAYLVDIVKEIAPGTYLNYTSTVNQHLRSYFGSKDVREVDINEIKLFMRSLKGKRKGSMKTIRNRLSAFLHWCWEKKLISSVPPLPSVKGTDERKKYAFSLEQQLQAVERIVNPVMRKAVLVMMLTGMRVSEALTLQVADVNLKARSVTIRRTWSGMSIKESTKTDEPRTIPLSYLACDVLVRAIGDRAGKVWIFPRRDGLLPFHRKTVSVSWKATGAEGTLRDATRRSFATICKDAGMDLRKIQELLGHKELRTTEIYLKDEPLRLVDELDRVQGKVINLNGTETLNQS